ncbi:MAG TPA: response regulator [Pseudomonadales bacterium]|jgi:two-component system KDP operon response regulator KdpE|nr:response regulator [Pseudomonadales bacterium]
MSDPHPIVVLIEDEPQIRRLLRTVLPAQGIELFEAENGSKGLVEVGTRRPDVVILDLGLPDIGGVEVVKRLREWTEVPVIILSARTDETDKIAALDAGADDYLTKPFGVGELLARLRVAMRRSARTQDGTQVVTVGPVTVDLNARRVERDGAAVHLTPIEYRLLALLVKHAGKVLTHRHLLKEVWGPSHVEDAHYLRIYMAQLRRKLEADATQPRYLITEPGVGYRLALT